MKLVYYLAYLLLICTFTRSTIAQTQCPQAPASPQDRRTNKNTLRIATYNAEWLFLSGRNCPGTGCTWKTPEDAELHLNSVASRIVAIDADILNIVEVQDCTVLQQLNNILDQHDMKYLPYLITGMDTSTGQNVGMLTRIDPIYDLKRSENRASYPLNGSQCGYTDTGTQGVSKHYYGVFKVDGLEKPLWIAGLHFLAIPDQSDRCAKREAQATVMAGLIYEALHNNNNNDTKRDVSNSNDDVSDHHQAGNFTGYSVVVMGDFNDYDEGVSDASDNRPLSSVMKILKDPIPDLIGDEMVNVARQVEVKMDRYSNWYDRDSDCGTSQGELSLIDHILVSSDIAGKVVRSWVDHSYGPSCNTLDSDHWPVVVEFDLTAKTPENSPVNNDPHKQSVTEVGAGVGLAVGLVCIGVFVVVYFVARKKGAILFERKGPGAYEMVTRK